VTKRLLLLVDAVLVLVAGWLGVQLYDLGRASQTPGTGPKAPSTAAAPAEPEPGGRPADPGRPPLTAFAPVTEKNLFSPNRTEVVLDPPKPPPPPGGAPAAPPAPKPRLYGIVIGAREGGRAYLEDPRTRRVFGYTIGDSVADSRLERIETDRVVMRRGSESFEVLLRDPTKPRPAPAPPAPAPGTPAAGPVAPGAQPGGGLVPFQPVPGSPAPFQPAPGSPAPFQPGAAGAPQGFPGAVPPGTTPFAGAPPPQGGVFQPGAGARRPPVFAPQQSEPQANQ